MNSYIEILKIAAVTFPFIALITSAPFILIQYHKYGAISFYTALIIYSLVLYLICAYFLVILPLPKISAVRALTTPRAQLIPFSFLIDFFSKTCFRLTQPSTYLAAIKESYFYVPMFNILLCMPFGAYLRYYFKCSLKKTVLFTFLLSLFFELTQLSGLYFIYPRGYRLFDVDDLFLNTLGGAFGYLAAYPALKLLPKREDMEKKAKRRGRVISGLRRTSAFFLDLLLFMILTGLINAITKSFTFAFGLCVLLYYFIIPALFGSSTLGERFLNITVVDLNGCKNTAHLMLRKLLFILFYLVVPLGILFVVENLYIENDYVDFAAAAAIGLMLIIYAISVLKYLFTNKSLLYERLSKTKLHSTIAEEKKEQNIPNSLSSDKTLGGKEEEQEALAEETTPTSNDALIKEEANTIEAANTIEQSDAVLPAKEQESSKEQS